MREQTGRRAVSRTSVWMAPMLALVVTLILAACNPAAPLPSGSVPAAGDATAAPAEDAAPTEAATEEDAAPEDAAPENTAAEAAAPPVISTGELTVADEQFKGMTVGFTAEGYPFRGSPDAPVVVYEYSDFQCPFCARYAIQTEPAINDNFVRDGSLRVVFRDFPLEQLHPNAKAAHVASLCVAEQGAVPYWELHDEIFRTQDEWSNSADAPAFFAGLAEDIGVDMDAFNACIAADEKTTAVDAAVAEAFSLGFSGTPSFYFTDAANSAGFPLVGAQPYEQFAAYINAMLAGEAPIDPAAQAQAQAQQAAEQDIPVWATAEGLAPDPDRPGFNVAGDAYRGNPDASVVVIEYSDFQCPFCRRHTLETQPGLDEQFVDTGDILWVYKHFPLNIHPQAPAAGVAAECAGEQGLFWEMHELLFVETEAWSVNDPLPALRELGSRLEMDQAAFAACLEDEAIAERVTSDMADGAPFVQGTPSFVVLFEDRGTIIPGALPADQFAELLQQALDGELN